MYFHGFTFADCEQLIETALDANYRFHTIADDLQTDDPSEPFILMRQDVDRKLAMARAMATLEHDLWIESTYYLRVNTFVPDIAEELNQLGHEVD